PANRLRGDRGADPYPDAARTIVLREGGSAAVPATLRPGQPVQQSAPDDLNGLAPLNIGKIAQGGFSRFAAQSNQVVRFASDATLAAGRSIALHAPGIHVAGPAGVRPA